MSKKIVVSQSKLRDLYSKKELSTYQIARIYGCDPSVIQKRLKEYEIKLRKPKLKINVSKKLLEKLYLENKLSTYKIAKLLKIGRTTIYKNLIEYHIKIRSKKRINLKKEILEDMYTKKESSLSKIAKLYSCSPAFILKTMKKFNIKRRDKYEANTKYKKSSFDGDLYKKAYMIGFRLGDLNIKKEYKNSKVYKLSSSTTKLEQVNLIKEVFGNYGHFYCKKIKEVYSINCYLNESFKFLYPKKDNIISWVLKNKNYFLSFLAGYTDAEGNIGIYDKRARYRVGSYDKNILLQSYETLNKYGINTKFRLETTKGIHGLRKHNKDFYRISVNDKESLLKLLKLLKPYIKHKKRYDDLIRAENNLIERIKS